ncbi:hypothetical protein BX616_008584 [Lobosporangium transversale]|nr:hypothetical protein BX616_008584 [Lobosporangium transversale]
MSVKENRSSTIVSSRDRTTKAKSGIDTDLRTVVQEVAIPGKYQMYFKPDKRATRKAEGDIQVGRSRSPKKINAAKWKNALDLTQDMPGAQQPSNDSNSKNPQKTRGFENVGWRALEQVYACDALPHPLFHRDHLEITKIKLLPDRKTFQLWYRPKADNRVSADDIAEAVAQYSGTFTAMLARRARTSGSSRLTFHLVRQSDLVASLDEAWAKIEQEIAEQEKSELEMTLQNRSIKELK